MTAAVCALCGATSEPERPDDPGSPQVIDHQPGCIARPVTTPEWYDVLHPLLDSCPWASVEDLVEWSQRWSDAVRGIAMRGLADDDPAAGLFVVTAHDGNELTAWPPMTHSEATAWSDVLLAGAEEYDRIDVARLSWKLTP